MRQATIAECFSHIGRGKSPQYVEYDGIKVINQACIYWDGIDYKKIKRHDPGKAFQKALVKNQDLLMNSTGTGTLGRAAVHTAADDDEYIADSHVTIMRPHKDVNPFYFAYFFSYPPIQERLYRECVSGSTNQIELSKDKLQSFQVCLPDFTTQNNIVKLLDRVQSLISLRKQQIAKLDELVKSRFVEMFGDPVSNSKRFPEMTLPELGDFGRGVSKHRPRNDPKLLGGKYPLIQTGEIANSGLYITDYESTYSELGFQQSKLWQAGTLCITIAANIAKTAILTFDACFPDSVVGFTANDKTNNIFIHYWFSFFQAILEAQAPESAQKNINLKVLSELKIIVPPVGMQKEFAAFVARNDQERLTIQHSLVKLETLKQALMQKYFG